MIEVEIGTIINTQDAKLQCSRRINTGCDDCYFFNNNSHCTVIYDCLKSSRSDHEDVYFKVIEDEK